MKKPREPRHEYQGATNARAQRANAKIFRGARPIDLRRLEELLSDSPLSRKETTHP
jgi:hypothetical protein